MMKPHKEFLQALLKNEGLDPAESVMVGNEIESDIAIALRCGIHSIYLNTFQSSAKTADKKIRALVNAENAPEELLPHMVLSGDIAEIL